MSKAMIEATERLVDDMMLAVRQEKKREQEAMHTPHEERLRQRYASALKSMNRLTEREAGQLLRAAAQPSF